MGCLNPPPGWVYYDTQLCVLGTGFCPFSDATLEGACMTTIHPADASRWRVSVNCDFYEGDAICDTPSYYLLGSDVCSTLTAPSIAAEGGLFYCDLRCPASYVLVGDHIVRNRADGTIIFRDPLASSGCRQVLWCIAGATEGKQ